MNKLNDTLRSIKPLNYQAMAEAQSILYGLVKPHHSLGVLEDIAVQIAGITGKARSTLSHKVICLFGSDHGVYDEGVCSSPQDFTRRLMHVYAESQNGGINVLARQAGAELRLYDLGVKGLAPHPNIITHKFLPEGTRNLRREQAMTPELVEEVITFGMDLARELKAEGVDLIGTGEVGMANTTPACSCIMAATNSRDPSLVGRGAGLDDESYSQKQSVILDALTLHENNFVNPLYIIASLGGLDIAAMTGLFIGAAAQNLGIIVDGVISIAAALLAYQLEPLTREYMFASHESLEPAYKHAAEYMKLKPSLMLDMRLGEGTGCAVFMHIIDDALAIINEMGDFESLTKGECDSMKDILVVDCQYDFIDGTLACAHAEEAVKNIITFINANPNARVFYSADNHGEKHCSYIPNGGTWPVHCQAGTHGAELHSSFTTDIVNPSQRPGEANTYYKGENDSLEEYSAFSAKNKAGRALGQDLGQDVIACGIATEFCVKESVLALKDSGRSVEVYGNLLGWVDEAGHRKTLEELASLGVSVHD